jgi:WD40-like Beta Propeller Repeat
MKKTLLAFAIFAGLVGLSTAAPSAASLSGGYFGNGSVKPLRGSEIFYNSLRFKVDKKGNVKGSAVLFATGGVQAVKRVIFRAKLSNVRSLANGITRAKIQGKFADGAILNGTLQNNSATPGARIAKGNISKGSSKGKFYGDGSGGSIVRTYAGKIEVTNLVTGKTTSFPAIPYEEGGVSVSQDGTIAHLQERSSNPEGVTVRLNKLDGTFIRDFVWEEPLSFVYDGARISPDGKNVAFCLRVPTDRGASRVYVFETSPPHRYVFWQLVRSPGWTVDNRLIAVENNGRQMFLTRQPIDVTASTNFLAKVGPNNLATAEAPEGTPDGKSIVFSDNGGVPRSYSMDVATGAVAQLLTEGVGQFYPMVGGQSLFYAQKCCSGIASLSIIHNLPFNRSSTAPAPLGGYFLEDGMGSNFTGGSTRYGYTPAAF